MYIERKMVLLAVSRIEKTAVRGLAFFLLAPLLFWISGVFSHAIVDNRASTHVLFLTASMPLITLTLSVLVLWKWRTDGFVLSLAGLLGIWIIWPILTIVQEEYSSSEFNQDSIASAWTLTLQFPRSVYLLAGYDGSLAALLIVSISLPPIGWAANARTARHRRVFAILLGITVPGSILYAMYEQMPRAVSALPDDPAARRAIRAATRHLWSYGHLYKRYEVTVRRDEENDDWHWLVDFTHVPWITGGHKTVVLSRDYNVTDVMHGQ